MTTVLSVVVPGTPIGASRPRVVRGRSGGVRTYMPDAHVRWEQEARLLMEMEWHGPRVRGPTDALVAVHVEAWHHRPKRLCRRKDPREAMRARSKPDLDNVAKLALDALVKAGVLVDDTQVCVLHAERWWTAIGPTGAPTEPERVSVVVMLLGGE